MSRKKIQSFSVEYLQILDENGKADAKFMPKLSKDEVLDMYRAIVLSRKYDEKQLALQRQGKIATFAQSKGQEGCQIGVVHAITNDDWLVPAFREWPAFIYRGVPMQQLLQFNGGDEAGSNMPGNNMPISIPVGSQCIHAVGIAMGMKLKKKKNVAMVFFGDGATSEGDFHEALNFAGVFKVPVIFVCQNNQYAISVPIAKQTAAETLAQKAIAYGIPGIKVDGNDVFGMYVAAKEAVERAKKGEGATLIEAFTYRLGDHTTADDASRYRSKKELESWKKKDPIIRLKKYIESKKWWDKKDEQALIEVSDAHIAEAVKKFEAQVPPEISDMFAYHYQELTSELKEQLGDLK